MAKIVGAKTSEVVVMNSLTVNVHFMMCAFYRPTPTRFKIVMEKKAFPSDHYATASQIELHGFCVEDSLVLVGPREGEHSVRIEDIESVIAEHGQSIALVHFGGLHYYSGQLHDMERITAAGHAQGAVVGFDLAHAAGNTPVSLHAWGVDFACWCTYKYMNSGPGSIAGCFVHERHTNNSSVSGGEGEGSCAPQSRLAGWFGRKLDGRFTMDVEYIPEDGANGFRVSNPPILLLACVRASLDVFEKVRAHYSWWFLFYCKDQILPNVWSGWI